MSALFQWDDSYSVKVGAMDGQHRKLFDLINELHRAMRAGRGKEVTGVILHRLIDYTLHHFSAEEKLLEKHNYPGLVAHRAEHKALTAKVMDFKREFDAGNIAIAVQLMAFLQDWLRNHILTVDQRYSDMLNAKGVR